MKSVKPGRGPSMMQGLGAIVMGAVGIIWTIGAILLGAPWFFCLFGVAFVAIAAVQAAYGLYNATAKNRFSSLDIVDEGEEPDPLAARRDERSSGEAAGGFCPYCGAQTREDYRFCPKCGRDLDA